MPNNFQGRMSDFDKGQIIAFRRQNLSLSQIAKEIKRPKSTIQTFLDRYEIATPTKTLLPPADLD